MAWRLTAVGVVFLLASSKAPRLLLIFSWPLVAVTAEVIQARLLL